MFVYRHFLTHERAAKRGRVEWSGVERSAAAWKAVEQSAVEQVSGASE